ncbi:magnesium/cobalt transporter CorA [Emticicia sp. 21SJ11W-3]|uniref:magnesium/cobalt transporter CorA n=1 Tax=Emticicia sp. 21SJ11W-3 TaxID=2916755 RepID=UPI0020A0D2F1|nr:magnesium/cobalt transporter CorA [Emticicia sp. 21SJ11W-3]UTA67216.1 magnesium/cobalt transporter CorA [Emticicia sp. 21SJ11W-3]
MSKHHKKLNTYINKKAFTSPGTLVYVGKEVAESTTIKLVEFNQEVYNEKTTRVLNDCRPSKKENQVVWLDVDGIHEVQVIEAIGKLYHLHPLLLEDILNTGQKPKMEHFGDNHLFTVLKMFQFNTELNMIESEHVALVLGENYVISFQEIHKADVFAPIFSRLKASIGKTRRGKADYLYYSCCDLVVDNYFVVLEKLGEKLEELEIKIIDKPQTDDQKQLYLLKQELMTVRKAVLPLRDMFGTLVREESPLIQSATHIYIRDLYDHVLQILDTIETYREIVENIQNIYLTSLSNKMNSVMKTLTVFTAIFMPLSFIAGIYGMNFDNMPELRHPYGYFYTLGGMVLITATLWIYFKWKKYV